jgi:hypothetical protein
MLLPPVKTIVQKWMYLACFSVYIHLFLGNHFEPEGVLCFRYELIRIVSTEMRRILCSTHCLMSDYFLWAEYVMHNFSSYMYKYFWRNAFVLFRLLHLKRRLQSESGGITLKKPSFSLIMYTIFFLYIPEICHGELHQERIQPPLLGCESDSLVGSVN